MAGPVGQWFLQNPHNLMEAYGVAGYEMPQTLLLNYSYELPFGHGRQFMSHGDSFGYKVLERSGRRLERGRREYMESQGNASARTRRTKWSDGARRGASRVFSGARSAGGQVQELFQCAGERDWQLYQPESQSRSERKRLCYDAEFRFEQCTVCFPQRAESRELLHRCYVAEEVPLSAEGSRYFEIRLEAQNIFNHANFNKIDNNPSDATFGGVLGKTGQRIMQVGARLFF